MHDKNYFQRVVLLFICTPALFLGTSCSKGLDKSASGGIYAKNYTSVSLKELFHHSANFQNHLVEAEGVLNYFEGNYILSAADVKINFATGAVNGAELVGGIRVIFNSRFKKQFADLFTDKVPYKFSIPYSDTTQNKKISVRGIFRTNRYSGVQGYYASLKNAYLIQARR